MTEENKAANAKTETKAKANTVPKFKVKKLVTLPLWKWKNDQTKYLRFDSAIFEGKELTVKEGRADEKPAHLANVTDLETGEQCQIIIGFVLESTMNDEYPDNAYVGKTFAITQHRDSGKKYNTYSIAEIEVQ